MKQALNPIILSTLVVLICVSCNGINSNNSANRCYDGLLPMEVDDVNDFYDAPIYYYVDQKTGQEVINDRDFVYADYFADDRALVQTDDERLSFINSKGEEVFELPYDQIEGYNMSFNGGNPKEITGFSEGIAFVNKRDYPDSYLTAIDIDGNELFSLKNYELGTLFHEGIALVAEDSNPDKYFIINKKGEIVLEIDYEVQSHHNRGLICVKDDEASLYGAIDYKGNIVIPFEYTEPFMFDCNDMAIVSHKDGSGYRIINKKNESNLYDYRAISPDGEQYIVFNEFESDGEENKQFFRFPAKEVIGGMCDVDEYDQYVEQQRDQEQRPMMGRNGFSIAGKDTHYFIPKNAINPLVREDSGEDVLDVDYVTYPPVLQNGNMIAKFSIRDTSYHIVNQEGEPISSFYATSPNNFANLISTLCGHYQYGTPMVRSFGGIPDGESFYSLLNYRMGRLMR